MQSNDENASSVSQPGLSLPTPSMQNQIHELAKTLPPPRKQNTACDACRTRKVKCNRVPGQDKCQHCVSKNYPCTHFVQQATSEKRRGSAVPRRPRNLSNSGPRYIAPPSGTELASPGDARFHSTISTSPQPTKRSPSSADHSGSSLSPTQNSVPSWPYPSGSQLNGVPAVQYPTYLPISTSSSTTQLLYYLFSPPDGTGHDQSFLGAQPAAYADWGEVAVKLKDATFRTEFALDLVEVYFQIVHTRIPLLDPAQFRLRLNLQADPRHSGQVHKPLHPALVATVLAWGCKFSEHPLLVADRRRPSGQSHLAKAMVDRARELAETMKVHRIPSADHVVVCLLIEPLQSQSPDEPHGFHGFWLASAIRSLLDLQINHKSVMTNIQDPDARGTMIFAWWMACLSDAYHAIYYRKKPMLDDDDYDIDFFTADPVPHEGCDSIVPKPSPREQLEFLGYYRASHALARIGRQMARQLWRPVTDSEGMPYEALCTYTAGLTEWRDEYLNKVGVSNSFDAEWDFVSAVSACASDATYHVMWIILFNALDDFGIREVNDYVRAGSPPDTAPNAQFENLKRKIAEEGLHGALRIAGLAGVLSTNNYLRLDPAVMHFSCIQAGFFLARLGRPESSNCILALEQYSASYEETGDQAKEISRTYTMAKSREFDFNHMASVAPRVMPIENNAMNMDSPSVLRGLNSIAGRQVSLNPFPHPVYGR